MPLSTGTVERSFNVLKRAKTLTRHNVTEKTIHRDIHPPFDAVVDTFDNIRKGKLLLARLCVSLCYIINMIKEY
jgi:hypothetical protein